jgi:FixJ family two-component response regulator
MTATTGYADSLTESRMRGAGAHAFLKKPFDDALPLDVVSYAIEADRRSRATHG